jgi:hypothetical protein
MIALTLSKVKHVHFEDDHALKSKHIAAEDTKTRVAVNDEDIWGPCKSAGIWGPVDEV